VAVTRTPRLATYVPGDPRRGTVNVRVRFRNTSRARGGLRPCGLLLGGANVLTCVETLDVGGTTDSKTTRFDFPHCSVTEDIGCSSDDECRFPACQTCGVGETCLMQSHCSKTLGRLCSHDADCAEPLCTNCDEQETCIRVLAFLPVVVAPGESIEILNNTVALENLLPDTARMTDTWTVTAENPFTAEKTDRYRIRGTRGR
jgi:hypothetical protein